MEEKIIETLKSQHQILKSVLTSARQDVDDSSINPGLILEKLKDFSSLLQTHMQLEDNIFYPQILEKQKNKGMENKDTEDFISEMKKIYSAVKVFLENYDQAEKIAEKRIQFGTELDDVVTMLLLRIESEEDGVYLYWSL